MRRVTSLVLSLSVILSISLVITTDSLAKIRMFGSSSSGGTGNPSNFYEVDPSTGSVALIGPIGFNRVGALATHPTTGVIYAAGERASDSSWVLITIDPTTGVGSEVAQLGNPGPITDIAFRSDGTLFLHRPASPFTEIYTISVSLGSVAPLETLGGTSFIGSTGVFGGGGGLAFTPSDSLILQVTANPDDNFYEINQSNGAATFLTSTSSTVLVAKAMKFHPTTGDLYVVDIVVGGMGGGPYRSWPGRHHFRLHPCRQ